MIGRILTCGGVFLISRNRINLVILLITISFVLMLGRLGYFQIAQKDELIQQVTQQREMDTPLKALRGTIYDRNMIPFTEREDEFYIIATPDLFQDEIEVVTKLSQFTGYSVAYIQDKLTQQKTVIFDVKNGTSKGVLEKELNDSGIQVVELKKRYDEKSLARHVIGYINRIDGSGSAGIEKAFNHYLDTQKIQAISTIGDAVKRSIPGLGYKITNDFTSEEILGVRLTLDYHIQSIVEEVLDEQMRSGAVIVTDVNNGDILALASRPNYLQDHIRYYMDSEGTELLNKAFCAYDVGSAFKIVVSAAALEKNIVELEHMFHCTGKIEVDGKDFTCHRLEGHGEINLMQGFAYSCNPIFIDIGLKLGYDSIIHMAKRFGFGMPIELYQGQEQQAGNLPEKQYVSPREIANSSIGQGEILATPLQVVDMVTTIANNGVRKKLNLIDGIVDHRGNMIESIRNQDSTNVIDVDIAKKIRRMMEEVTISGTGTVAMLEEYGGAGAKTGSAETGWMVDGKTKVHAWFVGYFPAHQPKYAMTVFVEDGRQGGSAAGPIFRDVAERVMKLRY